jgi:hypothetical protein
MNLFPALVVLAASIGGAALCTGCQKPPPTRVSTGESADSSPAGTPSQPISLPQGAPGIGFDDLRFSPDLGKVLVPAGRSGFIDLVDPGTGAVSTIGGLSASARFQGGHDFGVTSVDQGRRWLYATDRTSLKLHVIDPGSRSIVASSPLAASPDYVRWVAPTGEVWVTEPDAEQIEVFSAPADGTSVPRQLALIKVAGGPESLEVDSTRGRAYAHLWKGATVAIDLRSRAIAATWPNACEGSRGLALDEPLGWLFAGCSEGAAVVLDVGRGGARLSKVAAGAGVDIIAYAPALRHLYLPGGKSATMAILGVSAKGQLSVLGTVPTAPGAHCVTADTNGSAYVCDPDRGQLLRYRDPHPAIAATAE